jgi:hypothetical protein
VREEEVAQMVRRSAVILVATTSALMAGCSNPPTPTPSSSTTTAPTFTPEEVARAEATKAYITAYLTLVKMSGQPQAKLADYPKDLAVTEHLADPYLARIVTSLAQLRSDGVAARDLGMQPAPKVKSVSLGGAVATVIVTWCPPKPDQLYYVRTGKDVNGTVPVGAAKPPWLITSTMTRVAAIWKLTDVAFDSKSTCKAE